MVNEACCAMIRVTEAAKRGYESTLYHDMENVTCKRDADVRARSVHWPWHHRTHKTDKTHRRLEHQYLQVLIPAERGAVALRMQAELLLNKSIDRKVSYLHEPQSL